MFLSTIHDILRRRLSLFSHVARLDPGVPAHDALRLMVDTYEGKANGQLEKTARPPLQHLAQQCPGGCRCCTTVEIGDRQGSQSDTKVHSDYVRTMM